jgi:hypothetical protein
MTIIRAVSSHRAGLQPWDIEAKWDASPRDTANCSPVAHRRFTPIGGCLYNKWPDLFSPFANVSLKHNLNVVEMGRFYYNMSYFPRKWK